jgi:hypothetical protein
MEIHVSASPAILMFMVDSSHFTVSFYPFASVYVKLYFCGYIVSVEVFKNSVSS